ncbi:MAG: hypothetical protein QNJ42_14015 [Crocosphaera sp.]|nr:hypothetical protein [Crocosphaera sp.]
MEPEAYMIVIPQAFDIKCHEPLCNNHANLYRYPELEDEEATIAVLYCPKHAADHGFCKGCGCYAGGLESFEFGSTPGLCDACADDREPIIDDYDDYNEF